MVASTFSNHNFIMARRKKPLPFNPEQPRSGEWVKIIYKPELGFYCRGDVVQVEAVSLERRICRVVDPEGEYQFLSFDEVRLTLPPKPAQQPLT